MSILTKKMRGIRGYARSKKGMELVQVGILIAIAIAIGIVFKTEIGTFVENTFSGLLVSNFQ
ncbi:MAG: hypothetical protein ACI4VM_03845 [Anaerovoracaceae bacterium]